MHLLTEVAFVALRFDVALEADIDLRLSAICMIEDETKVPDEPSDGVRLRCERCTGRHVFM